MSVLGGLVSGLFGLGTAAINNQMAEEREKQARGENFRYGEMAADNADARTRALYSDLYSPQAQMQQIKEAGLSPSLFYGQAGGVSGQSGAQGTGAAGVNPTTYGINPLELAQIANLNAQTEKTKAETETEKGTNERGAAEIAEIWSSKGLKEASEALTKADTKYKNLQNYLTEKTTYFSIKKAEYAAKEAESNAKKAYWEAESSELDWKFNEKTFNDRAETIKQEAIELASRTALNYAQKELTDEEKKYVGEYAQAAWLGAVAHTESAAAYGEYIDLLKDQMPKQLELRSKEIGLEKWKIGVDAFNNLIRTAGYVFGATQLGDGGYETTEVLEEEKYDPYGHAHANKKTTKSTKKARLPKKIR